MKYFWACLECGRKFKNAAAAEKAMFSDEGCPGCGGTDFDNVSEEELKKILSPS
jgi:predicted  nucleic acid-binding Zn-ribbon protein